MAGIVMDLFRGEAYTRAMTIGLLSALSLLVTLHQAPSSTAMDDGIIAGHVVDAASEAPVVGARVTVIQIVEAPGSATFGEEPRYALTDASGQFAFQQLTPGSYRVDVEKSGFAPSLTPLIQRCWSSTPGNQSPGCGSLLRGAVWSRAAFAQPQVSLCPT